MSMFFESKNEYGMFFDEKVPKLDALLEPLITRRFFKSV